MAKTLNDIRLFLGITQLEVANKSNVTESYYNLIENGNRQPSLEIAYNISRSLNITLDDFFMLINFAKCQDAS